MVHLVSAALPVLVAEGVDGERGDAPHAPQHRTTARRASTPRSWPTLTDRRRCSARRALPSMMIARWRGSAAGSTSRGAGEEEALHGSAPGGTRRVRVRVRRRRTRPRRRSRTPANRARPDRGSRTGSGAPRRCRRATVGARGAGFPNPSTATRAARTRRDARRLPYSSLERNTRPASCRPESQQARVAAPARVPIRGRYRRSETATVP